jgi:hypothetical protein
MNTSDRNGAPRPGDDDRAFASLPELLKRKVEQAVGTEAEWEQWLREYESRLAAGEKPVTHDDFMQALSHRQPRKG